MLKQKLSKEELHELAESCGTMPDDAHATRFIDMLYAAILELFITSGDRDGLVALLAARYTASPFPDSPPTEAEIVRCGGVDQILVETDTFGKSPTFRRDVQWAVSHGYSEAAVVGKKDAALVKMTVEWFSKHRDDPGMGGKFADPILIVTDAFARSKSPAVRKAIAKAIRSAFTGLVVAGRGDEKFVANAVKWYAAHKDRLELVPDYGVGPSDLRERKRG